MKKKIEWFESWFDSPYYHILYKNRDEKEAELFIDSLYRRFNIEPEHSILDLACGKGRHSLYMASKLNYVTGVDLAANSISIAKKMALEGGFGEHLKFQVEDMRNFDLARRFDFIFNLFTSFGYFEEKSDNLKVIECISNHQTKGGIVIIDYLNSQLVRTNGNINESKIINEIEFNIHKSIEPNHVVKDIQFSDLGHHYQFQERVQLFDPNEIEVMLQQFNYELIDHYGDYELNPYTAISSRSILVGKKKS